MEQNKETDMEIEIWRRKKAIKQTIAKRQTIAE